MAPAAVFGEGTLVQLSSLLRFTFEIDSERCGGALALWSTLHSVYWLACRREEPTEFSVLCAADGFERTENVGAVEHIASFAHPLPFSAQ